MVKFFILFKLKSFEMYPWGAIMFASSKAKILSKFVSKNTFIFGPSEIGENTIVDSNVIIGYPSRGSLKEALSSAREYYELLEDASKGSKIGSNCHIRSGTIIYENVKIRNNVQTGHNVLIREFTEVGNNVIIGTLSVIEGRVKIGNNVRIESGAFIPINSEIGNNVFIGPYVVITNDRYPLSKKLVGATIEEGAVIGANAVLVAGVKIGRRAVVAAGAVVTKDVPPETVVAGVPAKPVSTRDKYEERKKQWERV